MQKFKVLDVIRFKDHWAYGQITKITKDEIVIRWSDVGEFAYSKSCKRILDRIEVIVNSESIFKIIEDINNVKCDISMMRDSLQHYFAR